MSAAAVPAVVLAMLVTMFPSRARAAGNELGFSPTKLSYGDVAVGHTQTVPVAVINKGQQSLTISSVGSSNNKFKVQKLKLPLVLARGERLEVSVTFAPTSTGLVSGQVNVIVSNSFGQGATLEVGGTGTATSKSQLTITPATLSFGDVAVGATGTQTAELSASGGSVTISSVSSSSSQFAVPDSDLPLTITPGKNVSVSVTFTPQKSGQESGKLSFASNATNSPTSKPLTGTGTAPFVSLSWVASVSQVSGYNVYRRTSPSGSYAKVNSKLVSSTTYTDKTVPKGAYSYATTAVTSKGEESTYSNQVEVVVP